MNIETVIAELAHAKSVDGLSKLLFDWRNQSGVAHLIYHATYAPLSKDLRPLVLCTYDPAWVARYTEKDYFSIDPVLLAGREETLPIDWITVDHETDQARRFFVEAESYGVGRHGFTLPIRGPFGERALFTFTTNETDHRWHKARYEYLRDFALVSHYLHDRAMQLASLRPDFKIRQLSRRERQCLHHLARGAPPGRIARQLNLSASAVRQYLKGASRKLGCTTIEEIAVKASLLGFGR
ncbi:LuxR family transcriptional regulator [Bradyrhizobium sp. 149]|uniref:helix-turn-helix transcriptional regulator n=1 Tax=Bradyrhizobium sp. 149 TaxID=2782624 RepID=UPI001FFB0A37|nr:LuxR family transcriptional regulator [Bradyrhizobium sp. 149]MCK1651592.1 LuxR family transcriptional regulator [Bradyrhizobium sp. 149]